MAIVGVLAVARFAACSVRKTKSSPVDEDIEIVHRPVALAAVLVVETNWERSTQSPAAVHMRIIGDQTSAMTPPFGHLSILIGRCPKPGNMTLALRVQPLNDREPGAGRRRPTRRATAPSRDGRVRRMPNGAITPSGVRLPSSTKHWLRVRNLPAKLPLVVPKRLTTAA